MHSIRFVHLHSWLLALSELFVAEVTQHLRTNPAFGPTIQKLDGVLEKEGIFGGLGQFAGTPFTCFSITKDYECNPHDDPTDYGYGFILWLYPGHEHSSSLLILCF